MSTIDQLMGLNPQGIPQPYGFSVDVPMAELAMQGDDPALMAQMGVPPMEDPYAMVGMQPPQGSPMGSQLTQQLLGEQPPRLGSPEVEALAQMLGLHNKGIVADPATDPMYSPSFNFLGGTNV